MTHSHVTRLFGQLPHLFLHCPPSPLQDGSPAAGYASPLSSATPGAGDSGDSDETARFSLTCPSSLSIQANAWEQVEMAVFQAGEGIVDWEAAGEDTKVAQLGWWYSAAWHSQLSTKKNLQSVHRRTQYPVFDPVLSENLPSLSLKTSSTLSTEILHYMPPRAMPRWTLDTVFSPGRWTWKGLQPVQGQVAQETSL